MLYYLLYSLRYFFSPFNVVGYITFRIILAIATAIILSFILYPFFIAYLQKTQILQIIRDDGPKTHLNKSGTPTMGGLMILVVILVTTLLWADTVNHFILWLILATIWLGFLGYMDDFLKVIKKHPKGLSPKLKLLAQIILAIAISIYIYFYPPNDIFRTKINIPYLKETYINLGLFYIIFVLLIIVGSSNAVNLSDGLDGLAIGCIVICSFTYAIFAYVAGHAQIASYLKIIPVKGAGEIAVFLASIIGAGLGFLWFNGYPAEIFMGDTGALFLGGVVGLVAVFVKQEIILILVGAIFIIEVVSVVLQVYSYKRYGRRIFKMAPIHHHFELLGWAEPKITLRFWIIGILFSLLALSSLKIR